MKKTLVLMMMVVTIGLYAQEPKLTPFTSIKAAKEYIEAAEVKKQYVMSNPEEDKIAKENGWYEMIERNIEHAKKEIIRLKGLKE